LKQNLKDASGSIGRRRTNQAISTAKRQRQTTLGMILPSTTITEIKKTFQLIVRAEFNIDKRSTTPFNQYAYVQGLLTMTNTKGNAKVIVHSINDPKKTFKEMKDFPPDEEKFDAYFIYAKATPKGTP
jgi:hypothetical protein